MRSIFIFKYTLDLLGSWPQYIVTPGTPVFRHFGMQGDVPCVWMEIEPGAEHTRRAAIIIGTGHQIPEGYTYCGTTQHDQFVWHLYMEG